MKIASGRTTQRPLAVLALALLMAACTTVAMNDSLTPSAQVAGPSITGDGYRMVALADNGASPEILFGLAFSGGGKRSAAFSYGVLKGLRDYHIPFDGRDRRLLDLVSTIAAVSGGSFTAAYYGLYRDNIFDNFERDFLKVDIESYIWGMYLLPWNWEWWVNPLFGTNDQMAKIYDNLMFHGATYADLIRSGKPLISVNATDINYGTVFVFTQEQFDLICSDLASYPVARAVAASSGFPILFTPITLENHAGECGSKVPSWVARGEAGDPNSREYHQAELARLYLDPNETRYIHLMDGGISDNLAMRGMINTMLVVSGDDETIRRLGYDRIRRILLVSADGQASRDSSWPQSRTVTSIGQIFRAVSGTQISAYNFETLLLARAQLRRTVQDLRRIRCAEAPMIDGHPCDDVQGYFVHLSLAGISDEATRQELQQIRTGLTIPDEATDKLVAAGEEQVHNSPVLEEFRQSLEGTATTE
jgi:NTE family protein